MVEVGCSYPFIVLEYAEILDIWAWKKTVGKVLSIVPVKGLWVETPALPKTSQSGTHSFAWRFNTDHTLTRFSRDLKTNYAEEVKITYTKWKFYFRRQSTAAAVTFVLCMRRHLLPCKDLQKFIGKLIADSYEDECWAQKSY